MKPRRIDAATRVSGVVVAVVRLALLPDHRSPGNGGPWHRAGWRLLWRYKSRHDSLRFNRAPPTSAINRLAPASVIADCGFYVRQRTDAISSG